MRHNGHDTLRVTTAVPEWKDGDVLAKFDEVVGAVQL